MPDMSLGDVTIHYEEAGQGPLAFVFCHGLYGGGDTFTEEFAFWKNHFGRVISWDVRGMGHSSQAAKYSLPLYASDLARLLDGLHIDKPVVLGFSWGSTVAQQFAIDYTDRCAAVVLESGTSEVNVAASEYWYQAAEAMRQGKPGAQQIEPQHMDSVVAASRVVAGLREHPLTPRLKHITCPVLVTAGAKDDMNRGAGPSVIMSRNIPNCRLHIFQDGGHTLHVEKRDEFRKLVLDFCREHGIING
ncbi:MAG: alpha/beta hydrolase [Dehalococcoidia bacterium]|nr:alpha/beta hydrolase [Dehalococcoidia bacterium]